MKNYFEGFNYSLANEDNLLEINIANLSKSKNILAIAGSGNRSLFLSSIKPDNLTIIDTSQKQLEYCQYKEDLIRENNLDQYWHLLVQGPLYKGKYEQTLIKYSKIIRLLVGEKSLIKLFSFNDIKDQWSYYENKFPKKRLRFALTLIGNPYVMNILLYKGTFVKKNIKQTHSKYYIDRFEQIFKKFLLKENFFVQLILLGKIISPTATICENTPHIFTKAKEWLEKQKPVYLCIPITQITKQNLVKDVDFVSYSNVPSYYQENLEINHMQELKHILSDGALVVLRYYLREPSVTNFKSYQDVTIKFQSLIDQERVNMYTIKVYQYFK